MQFDKYQTQSLHIISHQNITGSQQGREVTILIMKIVDTLHQPITL